MRSISDILAEHQGRLDGVKREFELRLEVCCRDLQNSNTEFRYRFIEARVKDIAGMRRTLNSDPCEESDFWVVDDLVGARVVVPTQSDVDLLSVAVVKELSTWEWTQSDKDDPGGYRGVHLKARYALGALEVGCEIQVRTILTDAWSWLSKEYFHHRNVAPPWDLMMDILSGYLRASDDQLQLIRNEMREKESRAPEPEPQITNDPSGDPTELGQPEESP